MEGGLSMQTTEDLSSGVQIIIKGHRELVTLLRNLRAAIKTQVCRYTIENSLAFLEEYVQVYFCEEEGYMKYYGYPNYPSHKEKHNQFAAELEFLREDLRNIRTLGLKGSYELSVETIQMISDWITGHVMKDDKELGVFLSEHSEGNGYSMSSGCGPEHRVDGPVVTICSICKKIRGNKGLWRQREHYRALPLENRYSRGLCPDCLQEYYADLFQEKR
jgi:hemerythrin-like metal-binding protein